MNNALEIINPGFPHGDFRVAIFDFDGTLSLLRRNWQGIMVPMMVDILVDTGTGEPREKLHSIVEEYVMRLTGKPTLHQTQALADEVTARGQQADAHEYLRTYQETLLSQVERRIAAVAEGVDRPDEHMVTGARRLLDTLRERGLTLYLASGTLLPDVLREVELLGLAQYFGPRVYGPPEASSPFSKQQIVEQALHELGIAGSQLLGLGDGPVETEAVKMVGGLAIGVASNEVTGEGISELKRMQLVRAGADIVIGDYQEQTKLLSMIGI